MKFVTVAPSLNSVWLDFQVQALKVVEAVELVAWFGVAAMGVSKHGE